MNNDIKALFQPSQKLLVRLLPLMVASWTFHCCGGKSGGRLLMRWIGTPSSSSIFGSATWYFPDTM